jgi:hypothetical protein
MRLSAPAKLGSKIFKILNPLLQVVETSGSLG